MRAPAPSLMPISGRPVLIASSWILTIFVHLAETAAEHRGVLAEDAHLSAVDGAETGHHTIADGAVLLQVEGGRPVPGQGVEFDEGILVQQRQDALPGGQLAPGVGLLDRRLADRMQCLLGPAAQVGQLARRGVDVRFGRRHG
jgi:hypothetical protein